MAVKMVTLPEPGQRYHRVHQHTGLPESGTKRPKPTTPKNDAFALVLFAEP